MKTYLRQDLARFLEAVDAALSRRAQVVVIGGAAAALHYGFAGGTRDIDTWTAVGRELAAAVKRAREATGLDVPFERSGIADGPFDLESRLERALPGLKKLKVMVPEKHDLVLMKVIRGAEHDLEGIEGIHRLAPLGLGLLVERYEREMGAVVIDPVRLRGNFLVMVERLFPDQVERIGKRLRRRGSLPPRGLA